MEELQSDVPEPIGCEPCSICGRTFNPEVLSRHQRICSKSQHKAATRKTFDSSKQRLAEFLTANPRRFTNRPSTSEVKAAELKKKLDWRRKHEQFIDTIKSARTVTAAIQSGAPLPPPKPSAPNPDYVQCPYCSRHFQEYAAERHIPFCKEKSSRIDRKPAIKAKESLNKRIQYKPPALRKRMSLTNQNSSPRTAAPPGSSIVMRNTNFSGSSPSSNHTRTMSGGSEPPQNAGPSRVSRIPIGNTSTMRSPISGSTQIARKTSFSRRANHQQQDVLENGVEDSRVGIPPSGGSIVRSVASRRLYQGHENSSDEWSNGSQGDVRGGRGRRRMVSRGVVAGSSGGSDRSSSPPSESEVQMGKGSGQRLHPHPPSHPPPDSTHHAYPSRTNPPNTFAKTNGTLPPLIRDHSSDSMGRAGSGTSVGSHKGLHLNEHGMPLSKFCYECGSRFPVPQAKYCCECGTKRL